LVKTNMTR